MSQTGNLLETLDAEGVAVLEAFVVRPADALDAAQVAVRSELPPSAAKRALEELVGAGTVVRDDSGLARPSYRLSTVSATR